MPIPNFAEAEPTPHAYSPQSQHSAPYIEDVLAGVDYVGGLHVQARELDAIARGIKTENARKALVRAAMNDAEYTDYLNASGINAERIGPEGIWQGMQTAAQYRLAQSAQNRSGQHNTPRPSQPTNAAPTAPPARSVTPNQRRPHTTNIPPNDLGGYTGKRRANNTNRHNLPAAGKHRQTT